MRRIAWTIALLLFTFFLAATFSAQESCPALTVPKIVPGTDIFSDQQEMWLGDAEATGIEQSITVLDDSASTIYLQTIVDRLTQNLPPNRIQFKVKLIDVPTADAFSIAGGRIYISRKLVAMTRSEDEMAGVLAHEVGHIAAHHAATEMSEQFHKVLGVTQVGDSDDIAAKWNQYLSNYRRQRISERAAEKSYQVEEKEQVQADTIALYLVSRAGYSTLAFETMFDRLAETKGNVGGFWSDLFGTTKPDSKRLRQLLGNMSAMPPSCVASRAGSDSKFDDWKKSVIEYSSVNLHRQQSLPGLISKRMLTERLRPEIQHIRVSPDGKYVLAQDDNNVFVLKRQPLKPVVRFDAPEAAHVQFTPDSRGIVFLFAPVGSSPRVDHWDIASEKRVEVHEVYVRDGCMLSKVSADGKILACLALDVESTGFAKFDLDLFDVAAGTSFFHKKGWLAFDLSNSSWSQDFATLQELMNLNQQLLESMVRMAFSPDGHYFVIHSRQNTMAMDLVSRSPIELPGNVKTLLNYSFAFLGNDRLAGVAGSSGEKSEVVEFPSGKAIYKDLNIGGSKLEAVAHGDYVLLRPIKDHPIGIFDLKQNKIVIASKRGAIDVWDDTYIAERLDGDLEVFELGTVKPIEHAQLPDAPLGRVQADAMSPDLNLLAVSQSTRGAVWNLETGHRLYHLRNFSGAYFAPDGTMYADFPKFLSTERTIARISLSTPDISPAQTIDEKKRTVQTGKYLLSILPAKENNIDSKVTMELRDVTDQKVLWSKPFPHERPGYHVAARANSLVLYWQASGPSARSIAKDNPEAAAALNRFKDKDGTLFVQVCDLDTGKVRAQTAVDTGNHSFQIEKAIATSDRLIIADNQSRVLVYGFDGQQKGAVAGHAPEVAVKSDLLTVRTESGKLELYDLKDVQRRATYDFNSRVAVNGFSDDGKHLLVLTSDQVVYLLDPTASDVGAVASK
jgi:WD40 repeat protein